ncbi:hypothetical protein LK533_02415 [Sphingomonas sp. PL-96]|uniref:hypothetical protein n=1 Tax=Sphingomonas sp. PL-96 TaxID=2887201 RepID=UPI001E398D1F|nr:hypothetical protein [Sphingomonas sp. PL-96]MCC2975527.1 hypothetical protein [Sphingomonas sp. PL-96]
MKRMVLAWAAFASCAAAEEPARAPDAVRQLEGCWQGTGSVLDKPVTIALEVRPVALGAMMAVDARSVATSDPADRYAAHLLFGGGKDAGQVTGFWSDSFGGSMTATGLGSARADGFEIAYRYSDAMFVNRWRIAGEELGWTILARDVQGKEQPFATYALRRVSCPQGPIAN